MSKRLNKLFNVAFAFLAFPFILLVLASSTYTALTTWRIELFYLNTLFFIIFIATYGLYLNSSFEHKPEDMRRTKIKNATDDINEVLTGRRAHVYHELLFAINKYPNPINQSEWIRSVEDRVDLTDEAIRSYIKRLEKLHLVTAKEGIHEITYRLTKRGLWCVHAIDQYFPRTRFWQIVRNDLGIKKIKPLPEEEH